MFSTKLHFDRLRLLVISSLVIYLALCQTLVCQAQARKPAPAARRSAPATAQDHLVVEKLNAYIEAYNELDWPFARDAEKYKHDNAFLTDPKIAKSSRSLHLEVPTGDKDLDTAIDKLKDGLAIKTALPEIDQHAQALLDALQDVSARTEQARNFSSSVGYSHSYKPEEWAKAIEFSPKLIASYEAAAKTKSDFIESIDAFKLKRELAHLATLKPGTFPYLWLKDSLDMRVVDAGLTKALNDPSNMADLDAALRNATATNKTLQQYMQTPAYEQYDMNNTCSDYTEDIDSVLGQVGEIRSALTPSTTDEQKSEMYKAYIYTYNKSIEDHNMCASRKHLVMER